MPGKQFTSIISRAINPVRVFIALMLAVILWLTPALFGMWVEKAFA